MARSRFNHNSVAYFQRNMERVQIETLAGVLELHFDHVASLRCARNVGHPVIAFQLSARRFVVFRAAAATESQFVVASELRFRGVVRKVF